MNRAIQRNLLNIATVFLFLQALNITLSPAVRVRSMDADLRWSHWVAFAIWCAAILYAHRSIFKRLPDADPYLFPSAALLSGWGLLTVWRLDPVNGARQTLWFAVGMSVFLIGLRLPGTLQFLRKYKYLLLTGGLLLTSLTLVFGTNPIGYGPRLWLGLRGIYFQPSEPLKLLLIAYLSAYLADWLPGRLRTFPLIYPTLILIGLAAMLLVFQRDLGTASIFIALYMALIYLATGRKRVLIVSSLLLIIVALAGYFSLDIIHSRFNSWLNPWNDPQGGSYQIIQSLLAVANGGLEGRGPGLGNPELVPVAISDFIYAAIAEETGLIGTVGLLAIFGLILARGLRASLRAPDDFRRLLAAGITSYFGIQAILIIGGNLRLLPLTGVTLPFVSHGGSSLLTSFIALLILLHISNHVDEDPAPLENPSPYLALGAALSLGLFLLALANGWWSIVRGPDLLARPDNVRLAIESRYVPRGNILDRSGAVITSTEGNTGSYVRSYQYPTLAPVIGYNDLVYGQAGLEAAFNDYLRGQRGNPALMILWDQLLYGMSPKGLDVRTSIDLSLQARADEGLGDHSGAVILLNAETGEILAMASHPGFDPNRLDEIGADLSNDPGKPLINRAAQGLYPTGSLIDPFVKMIVGDGKTGVDELQRIYESIGLNRAPAIEIPVAESISSSELEHFHVSPLQVALASSALSNHGTIPAPIIVSAVNTPKDGWVVLSAEGMPFEAGQPSAADEAAESLIAEGRSYWSHTARTREKDTSVTWFLAGTPPNWQASPLVVVVLLEEDNAYLAQRIGEQLLADAMYP